jgi:hypothetical protein
MKTAMATTMQNKEEEENCDEPPRDNGPWCALVFAANNGSISDINHRHHRVHYEGALGWRGDLNTAHKNG